MWICERWDELSSRTEARRGGLGAHRHVRELFGVAAPHCSFLHSISTTKLRIASIASMQRIATGLGASAAPAGRAAVARRIKPTGRKSRKILAERKKVRLTAQKLADTIRQEKKKAQRIEIERRSLLKIPKQEKDTDIPDPFADLATAASRVEKNIPASALQQLRRTIIEEKAEEDADKLGKTLPLLSEHQRKLRHDVDAKYHHGERGKHIWVFCHLRTQQVLYSLDNKLTVRFSRPVESGQPR